MVKVRIEGFATAFCRADGVRRMGAKRGIIEAVFGAARKAGRGRTLRRVRRDRADIREGILVPWWRNWSGLWYC